jgi:hypothetical protein
MFPTFGFSIQECFICYFYCQKMAFVCEFQHTPLWKLMISQMVRNDSVIFGRHIDIEVCYKILQLEVPKLVLILHYPACFQKGLFGGSFEQKHPQAFRG